MEAQNTLVDADQSKAQELPQASSGSDLGSEGGEGVLHSAVQTPEAQWLESKLAAHHGTVCAVCSGFGHLCKDCPTWKRLAVPASFGGVMSHVLTTTRDKVLCEYTSGLQGGGL